MTRVNKVTVYIGERFEPSIITLYRTNTKLAEITNEQLEIPDFHESKVDRNTYQQYCKDVVINLLENGGIEGFYWEPKHVEDNPDGGQAVRKFNTSTFRSEAVSRLSAIMDAMIDGTDITYEINKFKDDGVEVKERYKDMNVKYGSTDITMTATGKKSEAVKVTVELRSGQMCKPKIFTMSDGTTKQLNITTLNRMLR